MNATTNETTATEAPEMTQGMEGAAIAVAQMAASEPRLVPHTSDSLLYVASRDVLDGFRTVTLNPGQTIGLIAQKIGAIKATQEERHQALRDLAAMPFVIASRGVFSIQDVVEGKVELPLAGDLGYTLSLVGFKGLELPDPSVKEGKSKKNGVWAFAIYPAHSITAAIETDAGKAWLQTQMDKELGLVAFRGIRVTMGETTIGDLAEAAFAMPCALSDFTDRARSTSEAFGTFNDLWPTFREVTSKKPQAAKVLAMLPTKRADMLAALRSKVFAEVKFPGLESANVFVQIGQHFAAFVDVMVSRAAEAGNDLPYAGADVLRWLEGRDTLDLVRAQVETVDEADLTAALSAFGSV